MKRLWAPFLILAVVVILLPGTIVHMCALESPILEASIPIILFPALCFWVYKSNSRKGKWIKTVVACLISILIQNLYSTWLHSPSFPESLLSENAKLFQQKTSAIQEQIKQMESNQKLQPTVKTPVESGNEQGTAAEL